MKDMSNFIISIRDTTKNHRSLLLCAADRGVVNATLEHTALLGVVSVVPDDVTGVD